MEDCLIILDSSGSMHEEGKRAAGQYVLCAIAGFVRDSFPDKHCGAYVWAENITRYGTKATGGGNRLNPDAWEDFVAQHQGVPMILITDGNLAAREKKALASLPDSERLCAVMIGADANRLSLRNIVGRDRVFESGDAIECVRFLLTR